MIRGVNKRIIEISKPEEKAFEKVILFLNPQQETEDCLLQEQAAQYVGQLTTKWKRRAKRRARLRMVACLMASALCGGALVYGLLLLF